MHLVKSIEVDLPEDTTPLTKKVEEAMRLGFNSEEGAKLVVISDDSYRLISQLLITRDQHEKPEVRKEAADWLTKINEKGKIGKHNRFIKYFLIHVYKDGMPIQTWRKLKEHKDTLGIDERFKALMAREELHPNVRNRIEEILGSVVDGKLPSHIFHEAKRIIDAHKITKRERVKKLTARSRDIASTLHAIEHACNSCDNLADVSIAELTTEQRTALVSRICSAATTLLDIQATLLGGNND